jgi:hypothetical protein
MHTLDSLTWHVMDAMADDWESIVQIRPHVQQYCGATPDDRIFQILRQLHTNGLVRIMDLDGHGPDSFPSDPQESWFDMTDSGRLLWETESSKYRDEHEQV